MKIFLIEDDYNRISQIKEALIGHDLTVAEDVISAKAKYQAGTYDLVMFDHDLGGQTMVDSVNENTGYRFAAWVTVVEDEARDNQKNHQYPEAIVHSLNPVGAQNLVDLLEEYDWITYRIEFGAKLLNILKSLPKIGRIG